MSSTLTREQVSTRASALRFRSQAFIDGRFVDALSGRTFSDVSPATGRVLAEVVEGGAEDIDRAVAAARAAFEDGRWRDLAPAARKRALLKLADLIEAHAFELALTDCLDMGKPIASALKVDLPAAAGCFRYYAEAVDKVYDEIAPTDPGRVILVRREPLGVVGCVVPWNFPLMITAWKIAPALITGNSVVLKPAEQSPLGALRLAELAAEAGLPDGVLNVVPGDGPTAGQALGRHGDVDCIGFTGSTEVGKLFLKYSAESNMKPVHLECGGKSPNIILADAPDLDKAARAAAWAVFNNQGEACNAGTRLLVEEAVKDRVLEGVLEVARKVRVGDPLDPETEMGAIVDETQLERILGYVGSGLDSGAKLVLGGRRVLEETGGFYVEPTVFDEVRNDMPIARDEIFGPVLSTITVHDLDEAVRVGNDTMYGLYAAVWTRDITKAFKAIRNIRAGAVNVNTYSGGDMTTPFGGFKQSGFGRDKSLHALEKYTGLKASCIVLE